MNSEEEELNAFCCKKESRFVNIIFLFLNQPVPADLEIVCGVDSMLAMFHCHDNTSNNLRFNILKNNEKKKDSCFTFHTTKVLEMNAILDCMAAQHKAIICLTAVFSNDLLEAYC